MTFKYWTRNDIDNLLRSNDKAVERAIVRLFELQNADEQRHGTTNVQNGRGFCSSDARAGTRFARWIQGMDNKNVVRYAPKSLNNPKARNIFYRYCAPNGTVMDRARKIALKHSKQLVEIANEGANKTVAEKLSAAKPIPMPKINLVETVTPVGKPKKAPFQGPQPGTLAATARLMASMDDSGFDWDAWKDQMKEERL